MVFPTFFNLSLNLVIRSSWSEPQSAISLFFFFFFFADFTELLHPWMQRTLSIWFRYWSSGAVHVLSLLLCCWKWVFAMASVFSWQNSISLYPLHFVLQGQICLLLQVSLDFLLLHSSPLWWKGHLFCVPVLEGPVGLHSSFTLLYIK